MWTHSQVIKLSTKDLCVYVRAVKSVSTLRGNNCYLLDVGDVQCSVDQPSVHGMFNVFALLVQVHCLQHRGEQLQRLTDGLISGSRENESAAILTID